MSDPLITIGITCFAEGDWLLECWQSVLAQTDDRWTAVLVMDGTTHQRTREIFEQLEHPKLRKHAMPQNLGCCATHNKALELTETPFHFYLDADDRLAPNAVKLVLETFERFPEAGYVYGDYQLFGARSERWRFRESYTADDLVDGRKPPGGSAYRKEIWRQVGGFSNELARGPGDYDFFISAYEHGIVGRHCGEAYYLYRIHERNMTRAYDKRYFEEIAIILRRHPSFFAAADRRRRILGRAYGMSAQACTHAGDYGQALEYAKRAAELGETKLSSRVLRNWRFKVPRWFIPFGNIAIRLARACYEPLSMLYHGSDSKTIPQ